MLEGELRLLFPDGRVESLTSAHAGLIRPQETHWVEPVGSMRMQVEFYDSEPRLTQN